METEKSLNKMINIFNEIANLYILDIAKICSKKHPQIKIVLISAYRDFESARTVTVDSDIDASLGISNMVSER